MLTLQSAALVNRFIAAAIAYLLITITSGYVQAWLAKKLGDPTAEDAGFLSLNPVIYIDWAGALLFLLTGFGWGKVVPINPFYFSGRFKRFELFFAYASRPLVNGMLGLMTLAILDICFGGYALTVPMPAFFAQHLAMTKAVKSVLILMTSFSIFFSLYSAVLVLFRMFVLQLLGSNVVWYEAELISTLLAIFLLILFANQVEYILSFIVVHTELFIWYWWYTAARVVGFISWYQ